MIRHPVSNKETKMEKKKSIENFHSMQQYMVGHLIGQEHNYSEKHETRVVEYEC